MTRCVCTDRPQIAVECICRATADSVRCLKAVRRAFTNPAAAGVWLHRHCARLDGVPADLILNGRGDEVVAEARRVGQRAVTGAEAAS